MDNIRVSFVTTDPTKQDSDLDGFDDAYEIAMSRTYGLRGLTFIPEKHDDTIIFDSIIDDTNIFSRKGLPYDTYYQDNKDIECVRTRLIDDKYSLYQKNQYQFTRNSNTTAVYTITPDKNGDYIIKFSAHLQGNAHFSIKQQLSGRLYADISDELWSVVYDTYDGDYRQITIKAILQGGVTYRIEMLDLLHVIEDGVSKRYTLTIEQDNWVYEDNSGSSYTDDKKYFCMHIPQSVIKEMLGTVLWEDTDSEQFQYDFVSVMSGRFYIRNYDKKEIDETVKKVADATGAIMTVGSIVLLFVPGANTVTALTYIGKGFTIIGGISTATSWTITLVNNYKDVSRELFEKSLSEAISNNNYNLRLERTENFIGKKSLKWSEWESDYIYKYKDGDRLTIDHQIQAQDVTDIMPS